MIDLDAVERNFEQMKKNLTPGTQMIAVVKGQTPMDTARFPSPG